VTTLIIDTATTITANTTIPSTLRLVCTNMGSISQAATETLTINGPFEAGLYQVFSGFSSGKVTFGIDVVEKVVPQWWGAKGDGTTDDTVAIQNAISSLGTRGGTLLLGSGGNYKFSSPTWAHTDVGSLTIIVDGRLAPIDTLVLYRSVHLKGIGGSPNGQYRRDKQAIITPGSLNPVIKVAGVGVGAAYTNTIEGFVISPCVGVGILFQDAVSFTLKNMVVEVSNVAGAIPIEIKNSFWGWLIESTFVATTTEVNPAVWIHGTGGSSGILQSTVDLIYFKDVIFNSRGVKISQDVNQFGPLNGLFYFEDTFYENGRQELFDLDATNQGIYSIDISNVALSDAVDASALILIKATHGVDANKWVNNVTVKNPMSFNQFVSVGGASGTYIRGLNIINPWVTSISSIGQTSHYTLIGGDGLGYPDFMAPGSFITKKIGTLANDATPTVLNGNVWLTGGTTTITDFDDGVTGQEITIIAEHSITITDGTNIFLNGSANFVMAATDTLTLICKADNKWYEVSRSVN
jgi:hypothetical protein